MRTLQQELNLRGLFRIKPGLERMRGVLESLGNPQDRLRALHIAGTNGKGSVAAFLESVLRNSGYRTGLTISPHLMDIHERIQINREPISPTDFSRLARRLKNAEKITKTRLTYFEFFIAAAFLAFEHFKVDIAIVECGMGGLWDATNVLSRTEVSLITSIGLDHTHWLGKTEAAIVEQKAGIIKSGGLVISGVRGQGRAVLDRMAREKRARLLQIDRDFSAHPLGTDWNAGRQKLHFQMGSESSLEVTAGLLGLHQVDNTAVALAALIELRSIGWKIAQESIQKGLRDVVWPGRFQIIPGHGRASMLLDGAHNPHAMRRVLQTLQESTWKNLPKTFIFSAFKDKDIEAMASMITPMTSQLFLCPLSGSRSSSLKQLRRAFSSFSRPMVACSNAEEALKRAVESTPSDGLIVVTGSFALVGEMLRSPLGSGPKIGHLPTNVRFSDLTPAAGQVNHV